MEPSAQQSGPIKHKRNRTAQSCVQCRQRKVRCDRGYPCAPCLRSKSSLECSYDKRNPPQGNSSSKNSSILEHRAGRPTRQETHLSSSYNNRINENAAAVTIQPGAAAQSQRLIEDLQEQVQQLKEAVSGSVYATQNSSPSGLPVGANKIEEQPIKAPTSHLRNTWDKTKIYGPNNWIHTAGQVMPTSLFGPKKASVLIISSSKFLGSSYHRMCRSRHNSVIKPNSLIYSRSVSVSRNCIKNIALMTMPLCPRIYLAPFPRNLHAMSLFNVISKHWNRYTAYCMYHPS